MAVAISVHAILDNVAGQHLDHADFTRPGTGGFRWREVSLRVKLKCRKDLGAEQFRAAAVVRQSHQRIQRIKVTLIAAEVGFKGPECQQNSTRDAVVAFDPVKGTGVFLPFRFTGVEAVRADQALRKFQKRFLKKPLERGLRPAFFDLSLLRRRSRSPCHGNTPWRGLLSLDR